MGRPPLAVFTRAVLASEPARPANVFSTPSDTPVFTARGVCASCSSEGVGQHQKHDGPFHCAACWGDGSASSPPAADNWWTADAHSAWVERAHAALSAQQVSVPLGSGKETFSVLTDPSKASFAGVGATRVWAATLRIAQFLDEWVEFEHPRPATAVELGCDCGVPGMLLARRGWHVELTDLPWLLPFTSLNVDANTWREADGSRRPHVAPLRWGNRAEAEQQLRATDAPDLVIGADVTYFDDDFGPLLDALGALRGHTNIIAVQNRNGARRAPRRLRARCAPH